MEKLITLVVLPLLMVGTAYWQPTIQWQYSLGGTESDACDKGNRITNNMQQTNDGGYIIAGNSFSNDGDVSGHHGALTEPDVWIVKLGSILTSVSEHVSNVSLFTLSPNPAASTVNVSFNLKHAELISFNLFDLQGRKISVLCGEYLKRGLHRLELAIEESVSNGFYILTIGSTSETISKKIIIEK